jgi:hypothetical protein
VFVDGLYAGDEPPEYPPPVTVVLVVAPVHAPDPDVIKLGVVCTVWELTKLEKPNNNIARYLRISLYS